MDSTEEGGGGQLIDGLQRNTAAKAPADDHGTRQVEAVEQFGDDARIVRDAVDFLRIDGRRGVAVAGQVEGNVSAWSSAKLRELSGA